MRRRSALLRSGLTALAAAALALPAGTAPGAPAPNSAPANVNAAKSAPHVTSRHIVTLVSGDVVALEQLSDGTETATVRPTADRQNTSYATRRVGDQTYVIPSDAMGLLAAGKLDQELFNVSKLVGDGFDDSRTAGVPLIAQYAPSKAKAASAAALPGSSRRRTLGSINGQSLREEKRSAKTFWSSLKSTAGASVSKLWLNGRVKVSLADSVPQIGAPQAWQAGYDGTGTKVAVLDTGIDTTHPDLDGGKVIAAQNFSSDSDTVDHFGHGTHVASIVAGTGEGSPTVRKGVAPGASLLNGKVLDQNGSGNFDQIIAGLQWAADQGADVANMSLGTHSPSDGNDPLVQAVDQISESSGMLIVIAADNIGPGDSTITSPGWADEALTVGAVSKQDVLAGFSSRGPRLGDYGIKPDITAPGVDIIAARAAGTNIGPIVDGNYQMLSGTSMAAPHTAGAAAIMAQRFPSYTNKQLKDALISTAKTNDSLSVYQQGGGRVDVARAYSQAVYASPGTLNLGFFPFPHINQNPVTRTVTYRNDTAADVTLALSLDVKGKNTGAAPAGMFTVSQPSVTVPANGTASVTVTINPTAGPLDLYGGYLVGQSGNTVVHTSVGAYLEPEMYNLTVTGISRDGRPSAVISWAELWSLADGAFTQKYFSAASNTVTFRVPPGTYNLAGYLATADAANLYATEVATVTDPQLELTGDRSITLDARTASPINLSTQNRTAPTTFTLSYHRDSGPYNFHSSFTLSPPISRGYASPTAMVTKGGFEFYSKWDLRAPQLEASVTKPETIPLEPQPMSGAVPVDGKFTLPVEYFGLGKPEDFAGHDARGKIALISRGETTFVSKVANAQAAGAWGVVIFNNRPGLLLAGAGNPGEVTVHAFTLEQEIGLHLVDLINQGPVRMQVSGTAQSPYLYDLLLPESQRIPASLDYTIDKNNTTQVDVAYDADAAGSLGTELRHISRPWPTFSVGFARDLPRPSQRTEYVSANDTYWWHLAWSNYPFDGEFHSSYVQYQPRTQGSEHWFGRVSRPGASDLLDTQVSRTGDTFSMAIEPYSDSGGHYGLQWGGDTHSTKLYAGDTLLAEGLNAPVGDFPAQAGPATYRLEHIGKRSAPWSTYSTETDTTWTFQSSRPDPGKTEHPALLQVGYDLKLNSLNTTGAGSAFPIGINVGHIPGVTDGPAVQSVKAWVSFDDGGTWKQVSLVAQGTGQYVAVVQHPKLANTSGAVSLRVQAADAAGNSIDQTLIRAYGLS